MQSGPGLTGQRLGARAGEEHTPGVPAWRRVVLALLAAAALATSAWHHAGASPGEQSDWEAGRRIYEDGILPDGQPLVATRPEGLVLEGYYAACGTCHRRSGMGSVEGVLDKAILVAPVSGPVLFAPARFANSYLDTSHHYIPNATWRRAMTRPAYDEESLARSLREGLNSAGELMDAPMPLYDLDEQAAGALSAYLRRLTAEADPGVEAGTLHLASVITPDARPDDVEAVLGVLQAWADSARGSGSRWKIHVWELSGPSSEWAGQLQDRYAAQPVFALLSGVGGIEWAPIHRFCEQNRLPCILPSVQAVPDTRGQHYSLYFSPGVTLEARILARHLGTPGLPDGPPVQLIQVYADAAGRHAARTLESQLGGEGPIQVQGRKYRMTSPGSALDGLSEGDALALWLYPEQLEQLVQLMPDGPGTSTVFLSGMLASPGEVSLPPAWRKIVHFVSLFDDLGLQGEIARLRLEHWLEAEGLAHHSGRRLQADAYTASYLFNDALGEIREQEIRRPAVPLSREHLLEVLEDLVSKYSDGTNLVDPDSHVAYYGRMSLGPRQRIAVRGGAILGYASPESEKLVAISQRIVP